MTGIREATLEDVPGLVAMGLRFLESAPYTGRLNPDPVKMAETAAGLIQAPHATWLVSERDGQLTGMIAGFIFEHPFSRQLVLSELCWWTEPEFRGAMTSTRLFRDLRAWGRANGAELMEMIAPTDHVGTFYERMGFERTEVHYQRAIA